MAKGRSGSTTGHSDRSSYGGRRDLLTPNPIAKLSLPLLRLSPLPPLVHLEPPVEVEDRRLFNFSSAPWPLDTEGRPARTGLKNRNRPKSHRAGAYRFGPKIHSQTKALRVFEEPRKVLVCVRRQKRREVLFAKKRAGRGGMRSPRRTWLSSISCRR